MLQHPAAGHAARAIAMLHLMPIAAVRSDADAYKEERMAGRTVEIVVTNTVVDKYEARSYPDEQADATGEYNLYFVPVYRIQVIGTDAANRKVSTDFTAPRFMPYYNNPSSPDPHYKTLGWVNAGLSVGRRVVVGRYKQDYAVQNRYSPGRGAIVIKGAFYIHAGPASLQDVGFGSAGCIEIIGDYNKFKQRIAELSGFSPTPADTAIQQLVSAGKLVVTIQAASAPDIRKSVARKIRD
jgi:hypothetical protein